MSKWILIPIMVVILFVIIGVIGLIYFRQKNANRNEVGQPNNWGDFASFSKIPECFLTIKQSCFPSVVYIGNASGNEKFVFQKSDDGNIDIKTVRSILLADKSYKGILLSSTQTGSNNKGFLVDKIIETSVNNGVNPLVTSEILKRTFKTDLLSTTTNESQNIDSFTRLIEGILDLSKQIPVDLTKYNFIFSGANRTEQIDSLFQNQAHKNTALKLISTNELSSMQKSIIMYFNVHLTSNDYTDFIADFNKDIPAGFGTFAIQRVNPQQKLEDVPQDQRGFLFCNMKNQEVWSCIKDADRILCSFLQRDKVCIAGYIIGTESTQ